MAPAKRGASPRGTIRAAASRVNGGFTLRNPVREDFG
jgi:hypothetical protein